MKIFSLFMILIFCQQTEDVSLKKAFEANNDYYQGILLGKIKSIDIFITNKEPFSDKPDYVTRFDSLLHVTTFISNRGTQKTIHTFTYKDNLLLKDEVSYLENVGKPFNKTTYKYDTYGRLLNKVYKSGKNTYLYENDTLKKIKHTYNTNEFENVTIYNYSHNKIEVVSYDSKNRMTLSRITIFDEVKRMVTVNKVNYNWVNWNEAGDTIRTSEIYKFDNIGNEIERDIPTDFRRTQYLTSDSKGNWTNKIIYTTTDTLKVRRSITYY